MSKKTAIYDEHIKLGAKIVEFAGFLMPIQYKDGIFSEVKKGTSDSGALRCFPYGRGGDKREECTCIY
ncbi:hypothetical protein ES703_47678 [subsurface metagenome]